MAAFPAFIIFGSAGLLSCTLSLIALHLLPTGFHPIRDAVSNYAVSRYGYLYGIQAFSSGICAACLLTIFFKSGSVLPLLGIVALVCYSLSRMLIALFPTDVEPPRTPRGTIHMILAAFSFTGIAVAAGTLTSSLSGYAAWSTLGVELHAAALLTYSAAIAFVIVSAVRPLRQFLGLVERFIYLGTILWLGIVFIPLFPSLQR